MFKLVSLLPLLFLSLSFQLHAETIKLVAGDAFPPLMWNDNGTPRGIAVELGKAILKKAGYDVVVETCPWKRCQAIAEEEGAFLTGFSKNDERLKKFLYSEIIMYDDIVIVTKKGKEFIFKGVDDLKGKVIGAQPGVGFGAHNEGLKKGMIVETDNSDVARVKKILTDRIDGGFFSLGEAGIAYSAKLAGYSLKEFSILPVAISKDPNYLATGIQTPDGKEKIRRINIAIKALIEDGTLTKITRMKF